MQTKVCSWESYELYTVEVSSVGAEAALNTTVRVAVRLPLVTDVLT